MDLGLNQRVAVVTAAGAGIGWAVARALAAEGAHVVGADLDPSALVGLDGCTPVEADLAAPGAGEQVIAAVIERYGRVDVLVNGVGVQPFHDGGFLATDDAGWERTLQLNLMSAIRCARAALPGMVAHGAGSIINVGSIAAREPNFHAPEYAASKAALASLTKTLSMEFGASGVRCNLVAPGPTLTPVIDAWLHGLAAQNDRSYRDEYDDFVRNRRRMALPQMGTPEDVAAAVVFLASDAARQVTGIEFRVDGGAMQSLL